MSARPTVFILSCLMAMGIIFCGVGCGPDKEKESAVSPPPASEVAQPEAQTSDTGLETGRTGLEASALEVEPPQIVTESTGPETEAIGEGSADASPPAEFTLVSELWETHTKNAPLLTHEKHIKVHEIACSECHHVYEQGENIWKQGMPVKKCETCHDEPTIKNEKKLPPDEQKKNLKSAFHGNCRGCHKLLKKANPESQAPVTCSQCHPKK